MQGLLQRIVTTSDATKKDFCGTTFTKNVQPRTFFKFNAKKALFALRHIFKKVNSGIVQQLNVVRAQNWPGKRYLLKQVFCYIQVF